MIRREEPSQLTRDRPAGGILFLMAAQAFLLGSGYLVHIALGRILGPAGYGVYGVILSLVGVFNLLLSAGIPQAISKFVSAQVDRAGAIYRRGIALQTGLALTVASLYFLAAPLLSSVLRDPSLVPYLQFSALIIPVYALYQAHLGVFNGLGQFRRQSVLIASYSTIKVASALSLVFVLGIYGALSGFILGALIIVIISLRIAPRPRINYPSLRAEALLRFAAPYALLAVAINLLMSVDLFMVKALMVDNAQAGYYTVSTTLARIPYLVLAAVGFVMLPTVSEAVARGELARVAGLISRSLRLTIIVLVPGVILGAAFAEPVVRILYSSEYSPAAAPFSILLVAMGLLAVYFVLANIISGAGKPGIALAIALAGLGVSLVAGLTLIPRLGLAGASLATVLAAFTAASVASAYVLRQFKALISPKTVLRIGIAALPLTLAFLLNTQPLQVLLLATGILSLAYLGFLAATREVTTEDWREIRRMIPYSE